MKKTPKTALIVARPGPLRNSLFSLMASLAEIDLVAECRDMASLMSLGSQIRPNLILMEPDLAEDQLDQIIGYIKREWPSSRTLVLVEKACQHQEALAAGADVVLFKGYRAAGLVWNMKNLLAQDQTNGADSKPISAVFSY